MLFFCLDLPCLLLPVLFVYAPEYCQSVEHYRGNPFILRVGYYKVPGGVVLVKHYCVVILHYGFGAFCKCNFPI
jgi:hypothetical protein